LTLSIRLLPLLRRFLLRLLHPLERHRLVHNRKEVDAQSHLHGLADDCPDLIVVQSVLLLQSLYRPPELLIGFTLSESLFECFACSALDNEFAFQGVVVLAQVILSVSNSLLLLWRQTQVLLDRHSRPRGENLHRQTRVLLHRLVESECVFRFSPLLGQLLRVLRERRLPLIPL
jgi:hypothetical protein